MHKTWRLPKRQQPIIKEDPNDQLADYRDKRRPRLPLSREEKEIEDSLKYLEED